VRELDDYVQACHCSTISGHYDVLLVAYIPNVPMSVIAGNTVTQIFLSQMM
jgi:hypothetical protein